MKMQIQWRYLYEGVLREVTAFPSHTLLTRLAFHNTFVSAIGLIMISLFLHSG